VALLAIGLLLVTAEPWKVLWGLALSGAHLAHFLSWIPQTSIFLSTWGLSKAPWPRPSARAASGWRARLPNPWRPWPAAAAEAADGLRRRDELQPARLDLAGGGITGLR
jgi:hypothetical protein